MTITSQQVDAWDAEVDAAYEAGRQEGIKQEREACAQVFDEMADQMVADMEPSTAIAWVRNRAEFIRARGNK